MNYQNLRIPGYDIQEKELLGQGDFARVYGCKSQKQNEQNLNLCAKIMLVTDQVTAQREAEILNHIKVKHPNNKNLVKILEVQLVNFGNEQLMTIVMEKCQTDLKKICLSKKQHSNEEVLDFLQQILTGYQALYEGSYVHRDITPKNIMVNYENGKPIYKLADFGSGKKMEKDKNIMFQTPNTGTPVYAPPEINSLAQKDDQLTYDSQNCKEIHAVDIYSIGMVLWKLLYGNFPFETTYIGITNFFIGFQKNQTLKTPEQSNVNKYLAEIIEKMIVYLPSKRITYQELVKYVENRLINKQNSFIQPVKFQFQPQKFIIPNKFINEPPQLIQFKPKVPQISQQEYQLDFQCPIHREKILFLNLNSNIPKGNRTQCIRCQLVYPTNLDVGMEKWSQYKKAEQKRAEDYYNEILDPIKKQKKQLTNILDSLERFEKQIIQLKNQDIQFVQDFDQKLTLSKLQEIAELMAEDMYLFKDDYLLSFKEKMSTDYQCISKRLDESFLDNFRKNSDMFIKKQQAYYLLQKGIVSKQANQIDQALDLINQAIRLTPEMHELFNEKGFFNNQLGCILQIQGYHKEAIELFDQAINLNGNCAIYFKNKGDSLAAIGETGQAKQCYEQALRINPNYLEAKLALQRIR